MKKNLFMAVLFVALAGSTSCKNSEEACIDQAKADSQKVCTMEYTPVCGCDGKTYGNACEADRAGVTSYEEGACAEANEGTSPTNQN